MNFKLSGISTSIWITLSAVLILILFYVFYLEVIVREKEDTVISTRFRVIDQIGVNVDQRLKVYKKNADDLEKVLIAEYNKYTKYKPSANFPDIKQFLIDSIDKRPDINKNLKIRDIVSDSIKVSKLENNTPSNSGSQYVYPINIKYPKLRLPEDNDKVVMLVDIPYKALFKEMLRDDLFDDFVFIRDSIVIYNTLGQEMILRYDDTEDVATLESEQSEEKEHSNSEVLVGNLYSGEAIDISISNQNYKAFVKPVKIDDETWFAIGLMKNSNFNRTSRSVDSWIIILLSLTLIFIILGMPVIKLLVMSKTEELDTSTIISYALSVILGGSIMIMFVFFLSQTIVREKKVDTQLVSFSDDIYGSLYEEMDNALTQMDLYDLKILNPTFKNGFINGDNKFRTSVVKDILDKDNIYKPYVYPYGDYYFWVNKEGKQSAYMTPFKSYGTLSNLSSRDYVNKKDEWFFPGSKTRKFRLESIVSVSSGAVKAAISQPGKYIKEVDSLSVAAVSAKFYSIINTIIPKNYSFCIIDESGKVWFHSNESLNLKENFIEECNNDKELKALIYSHVSNTISVNYYNEKHRIYLRPIDNLPLYMVTMFNQKYENSFQAQVITLTLALIGLLLLMLFVQVIALLVIERAFRLSLTKNFIMKLTRPISRLNGEYLYLTRLYVLVTIGITPYMIWAQFMYAIASIFAMIIILFTYSYWVLNDNDFKKPHRIWFSIFNFFLLTLLNIISISIVEGQVWWSIILFEVVLIAVLMIANKFFRKESFDNKNYWKNYTLHVLSILFLFGIIPTLKFYELAYNTESNIRIRHILLDLSDQKEARNLELHASFYRKTNATSSQQKIFANRKKEGIYVGFYDSTKYDVNFNQKDQISHLDKFTYWDVMVSQFRPFYDDHITENKFLLYNDNLKNTKYKWYEDDHTLTLEYGSLTADKSLKRIDERFISSHVQKLSFYFPFSKNSKLIHNATLYNSIFWAVVFILAYLYYLILNFGISRIFCRRIITNYYHQNFKNILHQQMEANKDIFIHRLSPRDHSDEFRSNFLVKYGDNRIDMSSRKTMASTKKVIEELIIVQQKANGGKPLSLFIDHFDIGFEDPTFLKEKIEVIKIYIKRQDINLIIFSQLGLSAIIHHYEDEVDVLRNDKISDIKDVRDQMHILEELLRQLNILNTALLVQSLPVRYHIPKAVQIAQCNSKPRVISNEELIKGELSASDYLKHYHEALIQFNKHYIEKEKISNAEGLLITKINSLANNYYKNLFDSCSAEEKYVLFDLASDQIMNPKNEEAINELLQKGLLVKKCYKINFMNMSFRRFVLSKINAESKLEIETKIGKTAGTWQGYRPAIVMIIIALFVFITMANQDFLKNLNNLFVALGGGVAVITGVLGLLSRKSKTSSN